MSTILHSEECPSGWDAIFEGYNTCSTGQCCSIHGLCGTSEYHCKQGMPLSFHLLGGVLLAIVCFGWFQLKVEKRCISLMEDQYKKRGFQVDGEILEIHLRSYWSVFRNMWCLCDDVRMCMRNQLTVEYETRHEPDSSWEDKVAEDGLETPLVHSMATTVVVRRNILLSHDEARRLRVGGTIRLLVLPEHPCSGYPKTQVDNIVLRRRRLLVAWFLLNLIFLGHFFKITLDFQSLMHSKNAGWAIVLLHFVWAPPIGYYLARFVERKRMTEWMHQGNVVQQHSGLKHSVRN